jgi:hypothetical protein
MVFLPLTLTFVIASRHSGARARRRGTLVLIEGCALQLAGLAVLVLTVASVEGLARFCWRWCWPFSATARGW